MFTEPDAECDRIAKAMVEAAVYIHKELGNGLLWGAYELCMAHVLRRQGFEVLRQQPMPVIFEGMHLGTPYKISLIVNRKVIGDVRMVETILPIHDAQILSHLRLSNFHLGLLLNFGAPLMKQGIKRFINPAFRPGEAPFHGMKLDHPREIDGP